MFDMNTAFANTNTGPCICGVMSLTLLDNALDDTLDLNLAGTHTSTTDPTFWLNSIHG